MPAINCTRKMSYLKPSSTGAAMAVIAADTADEWRQKGCRSKGLAVSDSLEQMFGFAARMTTYSKVRVRLQQPHPSAPKHAHVFTKPPSKVDR